MPPGERMMSATTATHRRQQSAPGITYVIDTADAGPARGVLKTFAGVVVFAAGRGRLDIIERRASPVILVDGVPIADPLGGPGDYYLFDSTAFILVRPAARTFSSFSLTDAAYNYTNDREGWPKWFEFHPIRPDTVAPSRPAAGRMTQHGPIHMYWHLDLDQGAPSFQIRAAGRLTVDDAPAGEVSVVRWFGPSQALANMRVVSSGLLGGSAFGVTSVAPLRAPGENRAATNLITQHSILRLEPVVVDLSRLVLPDGFTETPWPGFEAAPNLPAPSPDNGAKWRSMPRT
jgi:hypothetical protein